MERKIRLLDVFSGIGGVSLAFEKAGFNVIGAIEKDANAYQIYKKNFPNVDMICTDIDKVDFNKLPEFDILTSSVHFQKLSIVGKRNIEKKCIDESMYVKKIIDDKRPSVFILETSTRIVQYVEQEMGEYRKMGYRLQWFIADSVKITGKPLSEKKAYILGTRNDVCIDDIVLKESQKLITLSDILVKDDKYNNQFYIGNMSRKFNIIDPQKDKLNCNFFDIPCISTENGIRRISCREYSRLKGFPDSFYIEMNNRWKLYRLILQSTNVDVAREIARCIVDALNNMDNTDVKQISIENDKKNLTNSIIDRQNILNNELALDEIRKTSNIQGIIFEDRIYFTKAMVASFFEVDIRTIERYVALNEDELKNNGYELLKGKRLKEFKQCLNNCDFSFVDSVSISSKITQLAIFDFKSFLNIGMLLVESENARLLRQTMLSIVIDFINEVIS